VRLDSICSQVPHKFDEQLHGYHWCYRNFTKVSKFAVPEKQDDGNDNEETSCSATPTRVSGRTPCTALCNDVATSSAALYPHDQCSFVTKVGRR